jgi:hypothetical protein
MLPQSSVIQSNYSIGSLSTTERESLMPMWLEIKSMLPKARPELICFGKLLVFSVVCLKFVLADRLLAAEPIAPLPVEPDAPLPAISPSVPQVPVVPGRLDVELRANEELDVRFETDRWERYVRRFRRAHNVAFTSGYDQGTWNIGKFGDVVGTQVKSSGVDLTFQYSYHAQLFQKFGYYLGSSGGYFGELLKRKSNEVGPSSAWKLPGIVGGFVFCFDPRWRMMLGIDAYLSRYTKITSTENGEDIEISMSSETVDLLFSLDYFVSLNWGVRSTVYDRKNWLPRPFDSEIYPTNAKISRNSRGATLGMVFHFL